MVLTMWDFATRTAFPHDLISTDKRKPTVNGNGHLYIVDWAEGAVSIIDPVENTDQIARVPLRNEEWRKEFRSAEPDVMPEYPSPYWGKELKQVRLDPINAGPGMMDSKGRTWFNVQSRLDVPAYCQAGSDNPFAKYYPLEAAPPAQRRRRVLRSQDEPVHRNRHVHGRLAHRIRLRQRRDVLHERARRLRTQLGEGARLG